MPALLMVSDRAEDRDFAVKVGSLTKFPVVNIEDSRKLKLALKKFPDAIVFWDVDHPGSTDITHPCSISSVGHLLREFVAPEKVIAISSEALNKTPFIFNMPVFNHHVFRYFGDPAAQIVASLAAAASSSEKFGLRSYVPLGTKVRKVKLSHSSERQPVLGAITKIFTTVAAPPQVQTLAVQTTDELIMNAVFDAPFKKDAGGAGNFYRRPIERNQDFPLTGREEVDIELAFCKSYFAIQVRDHFGSLKKDAVLQYVRRDYETTAYKAQESDPGAGLGIYGILQSGLSLLFATREGEKTEVTIFVPVVKSMKAFRSAFRLFSFL